VEGRKTFSKGSPQSFKSVDNQRGAMPRAPFLKSADLPN
jgi:hypothetical protein